MRGGVEQFPRELWFYFLVLFWFQFLPLIALFLLDLIPEKVFRAGKGFVFWRCSLCVFLAVSLLRQFEELHYEEFRRLLFLPELLVYAIVCVFIGGVCYRWFRSVQTYLALFGATSLVLTLLFLQNGSFASGPTLTSQKENSGTPAFMIVFDELSSQMLVKDGQIDRISFPNFAELASTGLWCSNTTSNHMATEMSLPSILTGQRTPSQTQTPTLFERLPAGYRVSVVETEVMVENWLRSRNPGNCERFQGKHWFLLHRPVYAAEYMIDLGYRPLMKSMQFLNAGMMVMAFQSVNTRSFHLTLSDELSVFLKTIDARTAPGRFSFWHTSIPHSPFLYNADGSLHADSATYFPRDRKLQTEQASAVMANYRSQVRFADRVLGKVIERLKKEDLYDKSILLVCADHGLRTWGDFYPHVDMTARVPLFIHGPGIAGIRDFDVQLIDIVPTLLDLLQAPYRPADFEGVSVFSSLRPERQKILHSFPFDVVYNNGAGSWEPVSQEAGGEWATSVLVSSLTRKKKFSALQVQADLFTAHEEKQDFLAFYLSRHFPDSVTDEELETIRSQAKNADALKDSPSNNFRKGSFWFFVALAETQRIAQGRSEDPGAVQAHWETTLHLFKNTGSLLPWMAEEIEAILKEADQDGNGKLSKEELASIITTHTSQ